MNDYHVPEDSIAILSQYKAQCSEIIKKMDSYGFEVQNIHVDTVVASQGKQLGFILNDVCVIVIL